MWLLANGVPVNSFEDASMLTPLHHAVLCAETDRTRDVDLPRHPGIAAFCEKYARIKIKKGSRVKVPHDARKNVVALCAWVNRRHSTSVFGFNTRFPSDRMRVVRMLCSDVGRTDLVPVGSGHVTLDNMQQLLETVAARCVPSEGGGGDDNGGSSCVT